MASERDLELLDDYISNRLTGADKAYIERKLEQDPDFRSEYNIQQQIAAGLRKARVAQLKQMLNGLPTPPANSPVSGTTKMAGAGIVVLVALSLAYLFWKSEPKATNPAPVAQKETPVEIPQAITPSTESEPAVKSGEPVQTEPAQRNNNTPTETEAKPASGKGKTSRINVFDPTAEQQSSEDPVIPENTTTPPAVTLRTSDMIVETDNSNKKYSFHYQVKDGKLILYGSFEKNLYEILEFFSSEKRTIFLYYRNTYYLLSPDAVKITPLAPVNDSELLSKLRQYRETAQ